jgi:hypothetical protein
MGRSIEQVRPALLSSASIAALDELRRFRHLFRHVYHYELDREGLARALAQAHSLREVYRKDVNAFLGFLDGLTATDSTEWGTPGSPA